MAIPPTQSDSLGSITAGDANAPVASGTGSRKINLNAPSNFVPSWIPTADSPSAPSQTANASGVLPGIPVAMPTKMHPTATVDAPRRKTVSKSQQPTINAQDIGFEDDEEDEPPLVDVVAAAPPWMVSLAFHLVVLIVLALLSLPQLLNDEIQLNMAFSETLGEQMDEETFSLSDATLDDEMISTDVELTSVEDPLASPNTELLEAPDQLSATAPFESPNIGLALTGREQGMKNTLLLAYGGDATTELAVYRALEWLKRNQMKDGTWRLDGPFRDGSREKNRLAATSMALLAFQGAGFTQNSTRQMINEQGEKVLVDYQRILRRAWKQMLKWQDAEGCFYKNQKGMHDHHRLYSQAQATIAICELYAMTRDPEFRRPAQRAVNYCCAIQDRDGVAPDGGWKYYEGTESDMSVTGWFMMALQSARMAGLDVPSDVFLRIEKFLESVTDEGSFYSYMPGAFAKPSLTAEGLLCRQYLGWKQDDPRLIKGAEYLLEAPIDWADTNTYYWYYATQVMHHMEGDFWFDWNQTMKKEIPQRQVTKGAELGSWSPKNDTWARAGGRLYQTCMCTYMLEVYYRHLPIYSRLY